MNHSLCKESKASENQFFMQKTISLIAKWLRIAATAFDYLVDNQVILRQTKSNVARWFVTLDQTIFKFETDLSDLSLRSVSFKTIFFSFINLFIRHWKRKFGERKTENKANANIICFYYSYLVDWFCLVLFEATVHYRHRLSTACVRFNMIQFWDINLVIPWIMLHHLILCMLLLHWSTFKIRQFFFFPFSDFDYSLSNVEYFLFL